MVRERDGRLEVAFVEVKKSNRAMLRSQRRFRDVIQRLDLDYRVERVESGPNGPQRVQHGVSGNQNNPRFERIMSKLVSGHSIHSIARQENVTRQTVQHYARRAVRLGLIKASGGPFRWHQTPYRTASNVSSNTRLTP